jgi:hypothetical protein
MLLQVVICPFAFLACKLPVWVFHVHMGLHLLELRIHTQLTLSTSTSTLASTGILC